MEHHDNKSVTAIADRARHDSIPIRRALEQTPVRELPADFTDRLMGRIRREERRCERLQTGLWIAAAIGALAALIAGVVRYFGPDLSLPALGIHLPDLNGLPDLRLSTGDRHLLPLYLYVAAVFLVLMALDRYLRHRIVLKKRT